MYVMYGMSCGAREQQCVLLLCGTCCWCGRLCTACGASMEGLRGFAAWLCALPVVHTGYILVERPIEVGARTQEAQTTPI